MWIDRLSRREAIGKGVAGLGGMFLAGCGGGSVLRGSGGGGGTGIVSRKQRLAIGVSAVPVTTEVDGTPVKYLFGFADTGIQGCCWGKAASDGTVETAIEVLAWDDDVALGSRVVFDARALPSRVSRELNGAFVTVLWDAAEAIFKFYLSDGTYAGGARVTKAGSTFDVAQLPDSPIAGHYVGTLANSRDGVFSISAGVIAVPMGARKATKRAAQLEPSRSRAVDNPAPALQAILSAFGDGAYPPLAAEILAALGKDYFTKGFSDLFMRIVEIATDATGTGGQFFTDGTQNTDKGASFLRGLLVAPKIRQIVNPLLVAANGGQTIPSDQLFAVELSPLGAQYIDGSLLTEIKTGSDRSLLRGTLSARDFGTVSVYGVVDPSGAFKATGSLGNDQFGISGTLTDTTLTGSWTSNVAARDGGGDMNGNQQPLGQCMSQQLSGGQGIYINSYDMGSCGGFDFTYQAYSIPDRFTILNSGQSIFDTGGLVSGGASIRANAADNDTIITVIVTASESGTAWDYSLGCPNS